MEKTLEVAPPSARFRALLGAWGGWGEHHRVTPSPRHPPKPTSSPRTSKVFTSIGWQQETWELQLLAQPTPSSSKCMCGVGLPVSSHPPSRRMPHQLLPPSPESQDDLSLTTRGSHNLLPPWFPCSALHSLPLSSLGSLPFPLRSLPPWLPTTVYLQPPTSQPTLSSLLAPASLALTKQR